jgi:hypothetical protein
MIVGVADNNNKSAAVFIDSLSKISLAWGVLKESWQLKNFGRIQMAMVVNATAKLSRGLSIKFRKYFVTSFIVLLGIRNI